MSKTKKSEHQKYFWKDGKIYEVGKWFKKYLFTHTTKRKNDEELIDGVDEWVNRTEEVEEPFEDIYEEKNQRLCEMIKLRKEAYDYFTEEVNIMWTNGALNELFERGFVKVIKETSDVTTYDHISYKEFIDRIQNKNVDIIDWICDESPYTLKELQYEKI